MSSVHPQHGTKALIRYLHKNHEAELKLVLAASNRSAQAKSQRAVALVEAFFRSKKLRYLVVPTLLFLLTCSYYALRVRLGKIHHRNSKLLFFCSFWYRLYTGRPVSRRVKGRGPPHGQGGRFRSSTAAVLL